MQGREAVASAVGGDPASFKVQFLDLVGKSHQMPWIDAIRSIRLEECAPVRPFAVQLSALPGLLW
jgi:hypothetical protein